MRAAFAVAALFAVGAKAQFCQEPGDCVDLIDASFAANADGFTYTFYNTDTADDYRLGMIRFSGDDTGSAIADQGSKGPILLMHSATQNCLNWLDDTADSGQDSIPLQLFKAGYDVWMGCRRGTYFSRRIADPEDLDISGAAEEEPFFNYNTQTVGENDVPAFITKILFETKGERGDDTCSKVQIITAGYGIAEAVAGMAKYPTDSDARIANVVALAPCAIPTYFDNDDDERRLLKAEVGEIPRGLAAITEGEGAEGRELWHGPSEYYWNVTLRNYCDHYPSDCEDYCDYYPAYCDEFCSRFPEFCTPPAVKGRCEFLDVLKRNEIYSLYGPNWESQVQDVCDDVGAWSTLCTSLESTVGAGLKEMSIVQNDHMFQKSYFKGFNVYDPDFCDEGYEAEPVPIAGVDGINVPLKTWYIEGDSVCDTAVNQALLNTIPGQDFYSVFYDAEITRKLYAQNDNATVVSSLLASLDADKTDLASCSNLFNWSA